MNTCAASYHDQSRPWSRLNIELGLARRVEVNHAFEEPRALVFPEIRFIVLKRENLSPVTETAGCEASHLLVNFLFTIAKVEGSDGNHERGTTPKFIVGG
jgi:hypothetical protein